MTSHDNFNRVVKGEVMAFNVIQDVSTTVEDERLAAASSVRVLISTTTTSEAHVIASRIHRGSQAAHLPFISVDAGDLLEDGERLRSEYARLCEAARGGSVLLTDIDKMSRALQDQFMALLDELDFAPPYRSFRLLTGTTVSLFDHVAAGTFSEQLFYRLNVLHLRSGADISGCEH